MLLVLVGAEAVQEPDPDESEKLHRGVVAELPVTVMATLPLATDGVTVAVNLNTDEEESPVAEVLTVVTVRLMLEEAADTVSVAVELEDA
jgi:hypothetical protein